MSGLDAFIPQPQDPADLPAALRNFAQWVEQQKTAMEATVRAEVAKVDQATIAANVLAQMPVTIAPFKVDSVTNTTNQRLSKHFFVPEQAKSVRISAQGAGWEFGSDDGYAAPWQHIWLDLRDQKEGMSAYAFLDPIISQPGRGGVTSVQLYVSDPEAVTVLTAHSAGFYHGFESVLTSEFVTNATNPADRKTILSPKVVFEWYAVCPEGTPRIVFE